MRRHLSCFLWLILLIPGFISAFAEPCLAAPVINSINPTSGSSNGGTEATIYGSNLANGATVTIGGNTIYSWNMTFSTDGSWVRFNTPAHAAGVVDVRIQNPDGQEATLSNGYTYVADAIYVNKDDAACDGKTPCYTSIQDAISAASTGTPIRIVQGAYKEAPLRSTSGTVTISGGWNSKFTSQTGTTEIYAPRATGGGGVKVLPNIKVVGSQ